ncbi:MAG: S8 family serine peptidase, partial [Gammaproteobacteria bacterium]|nr:S8 family serine peptidase [Gammaproteobacteria bacterium]
GYEDLSATLIAVVATDTNNTITSYSNRCGIAKNWCIAAPGDGIYSTVAVDDTNYASNYGTMSGTSMADPHVAGAVAILRSKWPSKSASQVVTILYDTATDIGAAGIDVIYGRGLLNLDNALYSQGALTVRTADGGSHLLDDSTISVASTLGNAFNGSFGMTVFDRYQRDYAYDMSQLVRHKAHANIENELNFVDNSRSVEIDNLWLKVNQGDQSLKLQTKLKGLNLDFAHNTDFSEVEMEGFSSQYSVPKNAQFASLNSGSSIMIGRPNLSLGLATGYVGVDDRHPAKKLNLSLKTEPTKALSMAVQLGHIQEEETFLANYFSGAYKTGKSNTNTLDLTVKSKLTNDAALILKHAQGVTQVNSLNDSVVSHVSSLKSQQYSATLINNNNFYQDDVLFATVKKPMHIAQGDMTLHMANGLNTDDSVSFVDRTVSLSAADLKTELTLGYSAEYAKDSQITAAYNRINLFNTDLTIDNQFMLKFNQKF